jgi:hypothetical protein
MSFVPRKSSRPSWLHQLPLKEHPDQQCLPIREQSFGRHSNALRSKSRNSTSNSDRDRQSSSSAAKIEQQLAAERDERKKISDARDRLSQQLAAEQTETQSLRDKSAAAGRRADQQTTQAADLESKVHELNGALDEKDRIPALDKNFLDHDREIRDLIAAPNLYIADIFDVAQNGKTAKPFGRIFYTKDQSLVFYGYDLDKQTGLKHSVAFQAGGATISRM